MKQVISIFIACILIMVSCKKNSDDNNVVTPPVVTPPVLLKKFILLDPTQSAPADTVGRISYTYDAQNRCSQMEIYDDLLGYTSTTTNYYNGTDTLISSRKLVFPPANDFAWEYFTYYGNGNMRSDSVVYSSGNTRIYHYNIINSGFITADINLVNPLITASYLFNKDAAGNIINSIDSSWNNTMPPGYLTSSTVTTVSYDNHPCPFYKLYPKRLVEIDFENELVDDIPLYWAIIQYNNILHEQRTQTTTGGVHAFEHSFSYQYNSDGYPTSLHYQDITTGETFNGLYFY